LFMFTNNDSTITIDSVERDFILIFLSK
jgi:hypothetical protein